MRLFSTLLFGQGLIRYLRRSKSGRVLDCYLLIVIWVLEYWQLDQVMKKSKEQQLNNSSCKINKCKVHHHICSGNNKEEEWNQKKCFCRFECRLRLAVESVPTNFYLRMRDAEVGLNRFLISREKMMNLTSSSPYFAPVTSKAIVLHTSRNNDIS